MEPPLIVLAVVFASSGFAALGGLVAQSKKRKPPEGMLLGLFLGPIGVAIEWMLPDWTRPIVDQGSRSSFHSMVIYQATPYRPKRPKG